MEKLQVHKIHHEFQAPVSIAAAYVSASASFLSLSGDELLGASD